jgi:phospholipid/cholesterol/gamma-HCH transport system substrate-binding protein
MKSPIVRNELVVGAFVVLAIAIGFLYFGKKSRERGLLDVRKVSFEVDHGSGLEPGAPVLMKGIKVGEIDEVQLNQDHTVKVTVSIAPAFVDFVGADALASVIEPPILGATKVELTPGASNVPAKQDQELAVTEKESLFGRIDKIEERVTGVIAKIDSLVDTANTTLVSLEDISKAIKDSEGLVGQLVYDPQLADDARQLLKDVKDIASNIKEGEGALALAINDGEFAGDLKSISGDVRTIVDDIQEGKGSLGKLYKESTLVDEAEGMITDVRGSLTKLNDLNDDAQASIGKVQKLLDQTTKTMKKVDTVVGSTGNITEQLATTLHKINDGEGTIASLLNDDKLYKETKSLLKELRESVEDLREQAPINSFIGVVFSAF